MVVEGPDEAPVCVRQQQAGVCGEGALEEPHPVGTGSGHQEVVDAVAREVCPCSEAAAGLVEGVVAQDGDVCRGGVGVGGHGSEEDKDGSLVEALVVPAPGGEHEVRHAVSVQVPACLGPALAEVGPLCCADHGGVGRREGQGSCPQGTGQQRDRAAVQRTRVAGAGRHQEVVESIAGQVRADVHPGAGLVALGGALHLYGEIGQGPGARDGQRTVAHKDQAFVAVLEVMAPRSQSDVGEPVAVEVAAQAHRSGGEVLPTPPRMRSASRTQVSRRSGCRGCCRSRRRTRRPRGFGRSRRRSRQRREPRRRGRCRPVRKALVAHAVAVAVFVEGLAGGGVDRVVVVVDEAVAVVVDVVADLSGVGVHVRPDVVAVAAGGGVASGKAAREARCGGVSVAVAVAVFEDRHLGGRVEVRIVVVGLVVAVVVHPVADLGRAQVDGVVGVVAVRAVVRESFGGGAGLHAAGGVAGSVAVGVHVQGLPVHRLLVDLAVAVVVDAVAALGHIRGDVGVGVVAVFGGHKAVAVASTGPDGGGSPQPRAGRARGRAAAVGERRRRTGGSGRRASGSAPACAPGSGLVHRPVVGCVGHGVATGLQPRGRLGVAVGRHELQRVFLLAADAGNVHPARPREVFAVPVEDLAELHGLCALVDGEGVAGRPVPGGRLELGLEGGAAKAVAWRAGQPLLAH